MAKRTSLTIGEKIRFFRQRSELTQMELELEAKLGVGTVNKIESGQNKPMPRTIHKIALALNLDGKETAYLLGVNFYEITKIVGNQNN